MNREQRNVQGGETTLYDTIMIDIYHYTLGQIQKMSNTKSEP